MDTAVAVTCLSGDLGLKGIFIFANGFGRDGFGIDGSGGVGIEEIIDGTNEGREARSDGRESIGMVGRVKLENALFEELKTNCAV